MSNFSALKTAIQAAIKQNGNNEITGDILQDILLSIVSTLGDSAINNLETGLQTESQTRGNQDAALSQAIENEATARGNQDTQLGNLITGIKNNIDNGYVYAGIATPSTTPVTGKVFYIATLAGTYTNLGNTAVKPGISILKYNGSAWSNEQLIYNDGGVFDVSAYNGGATYASLEALLSDANLSTIIPSAVRKGGMTIRYVQTSDNKYVQYRLMVQSFTTDVTKWQGVDDKPLPYSKNLVESNGVFKKTAENFINASNIVIQAPFSILYDSRMNDDGTIVGNFTNGEIRKYNVEGNKIYCFNSTLSSGTTWYVIWWLDSNGQIIGKEKEGTSGQVDVFQNEPVLSPASATQMWMNVLKEYDNSFGIPESLPSESLNAKINQNTIDISGVKTLTPYTINREKRISTNDFTSEYELYNSSVVTTSNCAIIKFRVEGGKTYLFSGKNTSGTTAWAIWWRDSNGQFIKRELKGTMGIVDEWSDVSVVSPYNAVEMWMNIINYSGLFTFYSLKEPLSVIKSQDIKEQLEKIALVEMIPSATLTGYRVSSTDPDGTNPNIVAGANFTVRKYNVTAGNTYAFSAYLTSGTSWFELFWFDGNGNHIYSEYKGVSGQIDVWKDVKVIAPEGATEVWMNILNGYISQYSFKSVTVQDVNVGELASELEITLSKSMKVVINALEGDAESMPFYIRTKYNTEKDIIITHRINSNKCITFKETYIGSKTLSDYEIMTSTYLVSSHEDSTGPIRTYTQYWHLFAQHGYPVPYFANSVGMTSADIGALWKDQLNREFRIGKVTTSYIWLLPVIYQDANGHYTRDWYSKATSTAITNLTYVSGGSSGAYTNPITISSSSNLEEQLGPIMQHSDRTWLIDGKKISEAGTYYCDELQVNENQIGYDPATIQDWFGGTNGTPVLTGAEPMAKFTYSFNYRGAQCAVNTTFHLLREAKGTYSGTQQQFFVDNGDYKAMFLIPKAAVRNGVDYSKPFNSPSTSSPNVTFNRDATDLVDIDNPVDRMIGLLYKQDTNDYLLGMAAGLSLVSGDTVKEKRNINRPVNSRLLNLSPSNNNKFYVYATDSSVFESGYFPVGYFKEINYYVSYFDPAENVGQVYWYKDGNGYVIYAHCQSVHNALAINVPDFMEGLKLTVVEKTSNTDLLTDTIQNGKFFVNYNTTDANYIVLKAN